MRLDRGDIKSVKVTIAECVGGQAVKGRGRVLRFYETDLQEVVKMIEEAALAAASKDRDLWKAQSEF